MVAGVLGERHQVGAHMVADLLETDGWSTRFLGTDVPPDALLAAVDSHEATFVGLGTTMPANLPALAAGITGLRNRFGESLVIVVGGTAGSLVDVASLGGDGYAPDVYAARELARTLGGS